MALQGGFSNLLKTTLGIILKRELERRPRTRNTHSIGVINDKSAFFHNLGFLHYDKENIEIIYFMIRCLYFLALVKMLLQMKTKISEFLVLLVFLEMKITSPMFHSSCQAM